MNTRKLAPMATMFSTKTRSIRDIDADSKEIQEIVRHKRFLFEFVFTKDNQLTLPFSRRPIDVNVQSLIDEHDASLLIRCACIDLRMDWTETYPTKKIIRLVDETITNLHDLRACLGLKPL